MATSKDIQVSYQFLEEKKALFTNDSFKTKIFISPLHTIGFHSACFRLFYDVKGKLNVGSKTLEFIVLEHQRVWSKGNTYEYEIEFSIPDSPISFSGENLEIVWYLVIELKLDDNTKSKLRTQLLKNFQLSDLIQDYHGKIIEKQRVLVSNSNSNYEICDFKEMNYHMTHIFVIFGIFIIFGSILIHLEYLSHVISFIAGGIGVITLGYGIYKYVSIGLLGKVLITGEPVDQEYFKIDISPEKNHHKIIELNIFYTINEEVIDNRGSSSTTYKKQFFRSKKTTFSSPFQDHISKKLHTQKKDYQPPLNSTQLESFGNCI